MVLDITNIQTFCVHDGPGIRTTVFLTGCPLRCVWCHNPETQSGRNILAFEEAKCALCRSCESCAVKAHRAVETCGHASEELFCKMLELTDYVMFDPQTANKLKCLFFCENAFFNISGIIWVEDLI